MQRDPIPTFGRAWSLFRHELREIHAALTSPPFWRRLRNVAIVVAALSVMGLVAARLSATACERYPRRDIIASLSFSEADIQWIDPEMLRAVPFESEFTASEAYAEERVSIFRPRVKYRYADPQPQSPRTEGGEAWASVVSVAPLPFIARSHYSFGVAYWGPAPEYQLTGGSSVEGVTTCLCGFGVAIPIHDWSVGAMY